MTRSLNVRYTFLGTDHWIAPEIIETINDKHKSYGVKADVWSFGIFAFECANREPPFFQLREQGKLYRKILHEPTPTLDEAWSKDYNDFVHFCCIKNPEQRPTCLEILDHPFLLNAEQHKEEFIAALNQVSQK